MMTDTFITEEPIQLRHNQWTIENISLLLLRPYSNLEKWQTFKPSLTLLAVSFKYKSLYLQRSRNQFRPHARVACVANSCRCRVVVLTARVLTITPPLNDVADQEFGMKHAGDGSGRFRIKVYL